MCFGSWHASILSVSATNFICPPLRFLLLQTPAAPVEVRLSLDTFEKAVNMLELMHFDAVKAWWEEQQSGEQQLAGAGRYNRLSAGS
jgi:hypothetical protein